MTAVKTVSRNRSFIFMFVDRLSLNYSRMVGGLGPEALIGVIRLECTLHPVPGLLESANF